MDFDLISAYSVRVYWKAEFKAAFVECRGITGRPYSKSAKCGEGDAAFVIVNLDPSNTYTVSITSSEGDKTLSSSFSTKPSSSPALANLYEGIRRRDGVYDTTRFEDEVHDVFLANFSQIVSSGDKILATVSVNGVPRDVETVAVREGSKMKVEVGEQNNLFLPFSTDNENSLQTVTLQAGDMGGRRVPDVTLAYDRYENQFGYGGDMYGVGDKFELFGQMVTVADGSIVLIFSDTVAKAWPFDSSKALSVIGSAGSHFMKNITSNVMNIIGEKEDGQKGSTYSSAWVHNKTDSTTQEATRVVHELDESSENATISIGVLHTDAADQRFIEPTLAMKYDATVISAQDSADVTASATFESTGLSFDSDQASIFFGAAKNFRIAFTDGTPALLQIQSLDAGSGEYVTRLEVSDSA